MDAYLENGELRGYVVNDVFVPKDVVRYVFKAGLTDFNVIFSMNESVQLLHTQTFCFLPDDICCEFLFTINETTGTGFKYDIYDREGVVGFLVLDSNLYSSMVAVIHMLYIEHKNCGIGSRVVKQLLSYGISFEGISLPKSRSFWERNGAVFSNEKKFTIKGKRRV